MPKSSKSARNTIVRGAAVLGGLQIFEQLTGLLSQTLIAAYFGASATTDAFFVALAIVGLVTLWIKRPIAQVIIPMFRHDLARKGEQAAWEDVSVLFTNLTIVFIGVVVVGWLSSPLLVRLIALGFDQDTTALAVSLTRITLLSVVFIGIGVFLSQLFLSYHRFGTPGATGIVSNLVMAGGLLLLGSRWGIHGLAVAVVAGSIAKVAIQLPILWRHRAWVRPRVDFRHPGMVEMRRLSLPVLVATGGTEVDRISDRFFASLLSAGSLSALAFARLLAHFPEKLVFDPLHQATFPHFTRLIAEQDYASLSRHLFRYVRSVIFLTVPTAIGLILVADLAVRVVFQRGAFGEDAVRLTAFALSFYAMGLPAVFAGRAFTSTFVSLKDTRTPMRMNLLRIGVKIVLALALIPWLAHGGIALAESASHYVRTALLFYLLPAEVRGDEAFDTVRSLAGTLGAAALMGVTVWALRGASDGHLHVFMQLGSLVTLGAGIYFAACWVCRHAELEWIGKSLVAITRR